MTHKVSTGKGSWLFVEVSPIAYNFRIGKSERLKNKLFASCEVTDGFTYELPPGSYTFIGTTKDISEEQAGEIVDWQFDTCRNYEDTDDIDNLSCYYFTSATESLRSLLIANQMNPELNYAILKHNT